MDRRTFIIETGRAFPVIAGAMYILSCGDSNGGPPSDPGQMVITATSTVSNGHSHTAEVPVSDLDSSSAIDYTSSVSSGHAHTVTLTAANFADLSAGREVTVTSRMASGHTHDFSFRQ